MTHSDTLRWANGLHLEMGRDLFGHCHWPTRTQACSDRPRGQARADWLLLLHPPSPGLGFHCLCWCPVLSCFFYPDGACGAKAVALPRHAALRFCNCGMPWAPSTVPVTLAWPIVLTAYPSPGGTSVLSNGLPGETVEPGCTLMCCALSLNLNSLLC